MKHEITWSAKNGMGLKVTVELVDSKELYFDGGIKYTTKDIEVKAYVDGNWHSGSLHDSVPQKLKDLGVVAMIGKVALTEETYSKVSDAIEACENSPEYSESKKMRKKHDDIIDGIDAGYAQVVKAMEF